MIQNINKTSWMHINLTIRKHEQKFDNKIGSMTRSGLRRTTQNVKITNKTRNWEIIDFQIGLFTCSTFSLVPP